MIIFFLHQSSFPNNGSRRAADIPVSYTHLVKSKLTSTGAHDHIMEQLEIDWKYADAMQAADNEKQVKYVVRDVFNQFGLSTTFMAKPMPGVAGNGEHTHLGLSLIHI